MNRENGLRVYGIAGCGFSGSTLISMLLGAHSRIFGSGEAHRVIESYRRLLFNQNFSNYCAMHHEGCDFWTPEFRARCDAGDLDVLYGHITRHDPGKEVVVHSFKRNMVYAEMLRRSFRVHGLIVLFKRPVAYYSSAKVHLRTSIREACDNYANKYSRALSLCNEHRIPVFPLFYEDLATSTERWLKSLCVWLGVDFEPVMTEPWTVGERIHLVGGNTGAFMNMWDEPVRNWILQSDTWKDNYTPEHEKWHEQNYRKIVLDEKWRTLPADEIARVEAHGPSRDVYEQLLHMQALHVADRQAAR